MGNSLSPMFVELLMYEIENTIHKHPLIRNFVCFKGINRLLKSFEKFINTNHPKIKFTLEIDGNDKINFLSLTIKKSRHDFSKYR